MATELGAGRARRSRPGPATIGELIGLVYESVDEPERWTAFLDRLTDASRGASMVFFRQDVDRPGATVPMSVRIPEECLRSYEAHYNAVNPWMKQRPDLLVPGRVATSEEMCPTDVLRRSEYYNDWLKPLGYAHCLGGVVLQEGPLHSVITAFRAERTGPASVADVAVFREVLPHLRRGVQLYFRLLDLETGRAATSAALDRLPLGVILLDDARRPILVNRAARAILDRNDGLSLAPNGLRAAHRAESAALTALIASVTAAPLERGAPVSGRGAGGSLAISRPSRQRPLSVLVSPLHADHYRLGASIAVAAVFVGDPEERSEPDADVIRRLYGLTRAETSLVLALLSGLSLGDAAEALAITGNTARTHLKRVFAKTGVRRQSELSRVLVTGPAQVAPT